MSTLSELIPSGGTQNNIEFVAQGTLANGQTVALRSDGKVEAITGQSGSVGTKVVFEAATATNIAITYDSANNKVVIVYQDAGNSYYGTAIVGTVSGTAITFGSAVVFLSSSTITPIIAFDSTNNKVVVSYYYNPGSGNQGQAIVGTVSGTSISFGSAVNMASSAPTFNTITYDSNVNRMVISYRDANNSDKGTSIVGTVSGTSISFGSPVVYNTANSVYNSSTFDSANNKVIIAYQDYGNNTYGSAIVGTVSGTSISFGTSVVFSNNVAVARTSTTFDSSLNKVVIAYTGASNHGYAAVGTVSGTSISFGTPVAFNSAGNTLYLSAVFDSVSNKIVISYRDDSVANSGTVITGTVSGTSISSFSGKQVYASSSTDIAAAFDVNANATVSAYYDGTNSNHGTASVTTTAFSNVSSYVGITDQAISSAATGKVVCKGGVSTGATAQTLPPVLGAQSTIVSNAYYVNSAYDSTTKNTVFQFYDSSNSGYGTARVASISGTTLTYGSPVVYYSAGSDNGYLAYDSNANKVVIVYRGAPSYYAYAVVGTVSGTSISFGTPVAITSANAIPQAIIFDSSSNKVVIAYKEGTAGKAVVGTVSGTSISFGSIVQFVANVNQSSIGLAYDSTNNKTVLLYANTDSSNNPTAAVGTVSGTSISFGSAVVINGSASAGKASITFDPSSGKVVVAYDQNSQSYVGTVSGTSISFGSVVSYNGGTAATYNYLTVDTVTNNVVLFYDNNSTNGKYVYGTVSGTSIAWSTPAAVTATRPTYGGISFNVNSKLVIMSFRLDSPQGGYVVPLSLSTVSEPFTIGSNYFVQDGGTLSTSSTSTKAGTALSTTSLLITG